MRQAAWGASSPGLLVAAHRVLHRLAVAGRHYSPTGHPGGCIDALWWSVGMQLGQVQEAVVCGAALLHPVFLATVSYRIACNSLASTRPKCGLQQGWTAGGLGGGVVRSCVLTFRLLGSSSYGLVWCRCSNSMLCIIFGLGLVGVSLLKAAAAVESTEGLRGCICTHAATLCRMQFFL